MRRTFCRRQGGFGFCRTRIAAGGDGRHDQIGGVDIPAVLPSLGHASPQQIPALIRTAWEAEKAFRALHRCRHVLDPRFIPAPLGALSLDVG